MIRKIRCKSKLCDKNCKNQQFLDKEEKHEGFEIVKGASTKTKYGFTSIIFKISKYNDGICVVFSENAPVIGKRLFCKKLEVFRRKIRVIDWYTSFIKEIKYEGSNIYRLISSNGITYIAVIG